MKRLARIFKPRADGTYQVSEEFVKQFKAKGTERNQLLLMFEKCNYQPDKCLKNKSFNLFLLYLFKLELKHSKPYLLEGLPPKHGILA